MVARKAKSKTKHQRAGLVMPVSLHAKRMRLAKGAKQIGDKATVYSTAIGDYIFMTVMKKCIEHMDTENEGKPTKRARLMASDLHHAIRNDRDLNEAFRAVGMSSARDLPNALDKILTGDDLKERQEKKRQARKTKKEKLALANTSAGMD